MMRGTNIRMKTLVPKNKLLSTLRQNLASHAQIVQEAREGYVRKAQEALTHRLDNLRTGKIVGLSFSLSTPLDYSEVYKNAIAMLEWNENELIEMEADEFRQLVLDEWGWTDDFYSNNKHYSVTAHRMSDEKGL